MTEIKPVGALKMASHPRQLLDRIAERIRPRWALLFATLLTVSLLLRVVIEFGAAYTDDDQVISWIGAVEMARLAFHEPCFYGQSYGVLLEAAVAAPAVALGVSPHLAVPVAATLVAMTPWLCLALLAGRRERWVLAVLAIGAPLLMPVKYTLMMSVARGFNGVALAGLGFLLLEWGTRRSLVRTFVAGLLLFGGLAATPNAALLIFPVLFHFGLRNWRELRLLLAGAAGGALVWLLWWLAKDFYLSHPTHDLYVFTGSEWKSELFWRGVRSPDPHLGDLFPLVGRWGALWLLPGGAYLLLAIRRRDLRFGITVLLAAAGVAWSLGLEKVHQGSASIYYPLLRMYLGAPLLLGWLALLLGPAPRGSGGRWSERWLALRPLALPAALLLCGGFALVGHLHLSSRVKTIANVNSNMVMHREVRQLRGLCESYGATAEREQLELLVFWRKRIEAWGCGALLDGQVETLVPDFERRTWRYIEERERKPEAFLLVGAPGGTCGRAHRFEISCEVVDGGLLRVEPGRRGTLEAVRLMGLRLRPFREKR